MVVDEVGRHFEGAWAFWLFIRNWIVILVTGARECYFRSFVDGWIDQRCVFPDLNGSVRHPACVFEVLLELCGLVTSIGRVG